MDDASAAPVSAAPGKPPATLEFLPAGDEDDDSSQKQQQPTPPATPPLEASAGPDVTDLLLKIDALEAKVKALERKNGDLVGEKQQLSAQVGRLGETLETVQGERDDARRDLDALRRESDGLRRDNADMKRILDALGIDLAEQLEQLRDEKSANERLSSEAAKLKRETDNLRNREEQQEFCDIGAMELAVKAEDVEAMEYELQQIRYGGMLEDHQKAALSRTVAQLDSFLTGLVDRLRDRTFATPTLESQRLSLIQDAASLHGRALLVGHQVDMA